MAPHAEQTHRRRDAGEQRRQRRVAAAVAPHRVQVEQRAARVGALPQPQRHDARAALRRRGDAAEEVSLEGVARRRRARRIRQRRRVAVVAAAAKDAGDAVLRRHADGAHTDEGAAARRPSERRDGRRREVRLGDEDGGGGRDREVAREHVGRQPYAHELGPRDRVALGGRQRQRERLVAVDADVVARDRLLDVRRPPVGLVGGVAGAREPRRELVRGDGVGRGREHVGAVVLVAQLQRQVGAARDDARLAQLEQQLQRRGGAVLEQPPIARRRPRGWRRRRGGRGARRRCDVWDRRRRGRRRRRRRRLWDRGRHPRRVEWTRRRGRQGRGRGGRGRVGQGWRRWRRRQRHLLAAGAGARVRLTARTDLA